MNKDMDVLGQARNAIEEGRAALSQGSVISFTYVPRNANQVAHSLAS